MQHQRPSSVGGHNNNTNNSSAVHTPYSSSASLFAAAASASASAHAASSLPALSPDRIRAALLGGGPSSSSSASSPVPPGSPLLLPPPPPSLRPTLAPDASTTLVHRASGALNAMALSPDRDLAVVAGREVLKIVRISDGVVKDHMNLRTGARINLNLSSNDVKWGNAGAKSTIATAATNGAIVVWDLTRTGQKLDRVITEHARAVNRLAFHATDPHLLLSASQDGLLKLWDLRTKSTATHSFDGKAESVRDCQFSPTNPNEFAAAFENGIVQVWDLRRPQACEQKFTAHNGLVLAVDYHAGGRWLASGGRDKLIKVWDLRSLASGTLPRPTFTVQTIASVGRLAWRPAPTHASTAYQHSIGGSVGAGGFPAATASTPPTSSMHLASSALLTDARVHVWDLARPSIPRFWFDEHTNAATGFVWADADTLWSCGKDKRVVHRSVAAAFDPSTVLPRASVTWGIDGEIVACVDVRVQSSTAAAADRSHAWESAAGVTAEGGALGATHGVTPVELLEAEPYKSPMVAPGLFSRRSKFRPDGRVTHSPSSSSAQVSGLAAAAIAEEQQSATIPEYKPSQLAFQLTPALPMGHPMDDMRGVLYQAEHYCLSVPFDTSPKQVAADFAAACAHNAVVAAEIGRESEWRTWQLAGTLFLPLVLDTAARLSAAATTAVAATTTAESGPPFLGTSHLSGSPASLDATPSLGSRPSALLSSSRANSLSGSTDPWTGMPATPATTAVVPTGGGPVGLGVRRGVGTPPPLAPMMLAGGSTPPDSSASSSSSTLGRARVRARSGSQASGLATTAAATAAAAASYVGSPCDSPMAHSIGAGGGGGGGGGSGSLISPRPLSAGSSSASRPSTAMTVIGPLPLTPRASSGPGGSSSVPGGGGTGSRSAFAPSLAASTPPSLLMRGLMGDDASVGASLSATSVAGSFVDLSTAIDMARDVLEYHSDAGEVHMCATLAGLLSGGGAASTVPTWMDKLVVEEWFLGFLEILSRFKQYASAVAVLGACPLPDVRAQMFESTVVHTSCNMCFKPILGRPEGVWACERCMKLVNPCSLCHRLVRGQYAWCQGCGHGGHLQCLSEWFGSGVRECATGCGHACELC
ncbi:hypothetical protein BC828DRAFT_378906 [Blastocladiella britannica]|nr:hypothetical protein BC828DRAFT_378906 [Blastocladiella britannica]